MNLKHFQGIFWRAVFNLNKCSQHQQNLLI
jgi:hypothetical protein